MSLAPTLLFALLIPATVAASVPAGEAPASPAGDASAVTLVAAARAVPVRTEPLLSMPGTEQLPAWAADRPRPRALSTMYVALGTLHALDAYSTRRAIGRGAVESNPLMRPAAGNVGATLAVKSAATAASIYFAEKAWKRNRKGAVILMGVLNGVTAAVVAKNLHQR